MQTTNTAEWNITAEMTPANREAAAQIDPTLLDFLGAHTCAAILERREKLGNGTGGMQEREELAILYAHALTLGLDPLTLAPMTKEAFLALPADERDDMVRAIANSVRLVQWGRRQAGLVG